MGRSIERLLGQGTAEYPGGMGEVNFSFKNDQPFAIVVIEPPPYLCVSPSRVANAMHSAGSVGSVLRWLWLPSSSSG